MNDSNRVMFGGIYVFVMIACVLISTFTSYLGLKSSLGFLAVPGALLIGVCLFAADMIIQQNISNRRNWLLPLCFFMIPLFFSTVSNFTQFYSKYMRDQTSQSTFSQAHNSFTRNMGVARETIENLPDFRQAKELELYVQQELENVLEQSTDANNPGIGARAQVHINAVQAQLDVKVTEKARPGRNDLQGIIAWVADFSSRVTQNLNAQLEEQTAPYDVLLQDIGDQTATYQTIAGELRSKSGNAANKAQLEYVDRMQNDLKDLQSKINPVLAEKGIAPLNLEGVKVGTGKLDEIVPALKEGFIVRPNIGATIFSLILSMFIDLLPLLFALMLMRPGSGSLPRPNSADGPSQGRQLNIRN